jgi:hypothetical protein
METFHRKIAPKKETTKKRSVYTSMSSLNGHLSVPPPRLHGQCRGIGKNGINVKIVRFFLFRNLSSERQVKARNPTPQRREDLSHAWFESYRLRRRGSVPKGDRQISSVLATRETRKTTRFRQRDAKCNAAGAMHRASMGATELQSNWPEMRKNQSSQESGK